MRQAPKVDSAMYPWDEVGAFYLEAAITKTRSQLPCVDYPPKLAAEWWNAAEGFRRCSWFGGAARCQEKGAAHSGTTPYFLSRFALIKA
jgi:hypothetical protein